MLINKMQPSFSGKFQINIKDEKPEQIFYVANMSINPDIKVRPANSDESISAKGANFIVDVPDEMDQTFSKMLKSQNIRFNRLA